MFLLSVCLLLCRLLLSGVFSFPLLSDLYAHQSLHHSCLYPPFQIVPIVIYLQVIPNSTHHSNFYPTFQFVPTIPICTHHSSLCTSFLFVHTIPICTGHSNLYTSFPSALLYISRGERKSSGKLGYRKSHQRKSHITFYIKLLTLLLFTHM